MSGEPSDGGREEAIADGIGPRAAQSLAEVSALPTSLRAVLDYYATTGEFAFDVVRLQRRVDAYVEEVIDEAFAPVEQAIAEEAGVDPDAVSFAYDTKLTMPAELTLGHLYQRASVGSPAGFDPVDRSRRRSPLERVPIVGSATKPDEAAYERAREQVAAVERAEAVTELVVVALLDGDMRDAMNDAEYDDFRVEGAPGVDRPRTAEIAQRVLRERVEELFEGYPDAVRGAYREAVDRSEAHQDRDPYFRELMADAREGDADALAAIRDEYKHGSFVGPDPDSDGDLDDVAPVADPVIRPAELFVGDEPAFPYLKTQYGRVGVIYDGMIEMYRAAGIEIEDAFKRSIVFTIIGAQIWLDDIDDYADDLAEVQLTPVTAEYLLADTEREAYRNVVDATTRYLDAAERYAAETNSPLAGIGTNYVFRRGDPSVLPGHAD
ncbi:hypothetical protein [Halorubrum sp. JWXQ-INN 858]|uniref:hypothetical protein n=1 Tax=Halorubrum sp. JWXQ-INN 858 TaxID=2690782 RepID=UPI00190F85DD|nr:hypothetical protein [Halorubrum sp. JWXQ-INN 858]